jgi:hypothetical protein
MDTKPGVSGYQLLNGGTDLGVLAINADLTSPCPYRLLADRVDLYREKINVGPIGCEADPPASQTRVCHFSPSSTVVATI